MQGNYAILLTQSGSKGLSELVWPSAFQAMLLVNQIVYHHVADRVDPRGVMALTL